MKKLWIAALACACVPNTQAQVELIFTAGSSHFMGDLGGKASTGTFDFTDLNLQSTRYMGGLGARVHLNKFIALRANGYYARVSADDKYTSNKARNNRNLNFFSPITGANLLAEITLATSKNNEGRFYVFGGGEYFQFNPQTKYNGKTVALQPLGTEGQFFMPGKKPYSLTSWAIPFGVGYKFKFFNTGYLSFEVQARKTFTDYIDDVSTNYADKTALLASNGQTAVDLSDRSKGEIPGSADAGAVRGHSGHNDSYVFLTVSYNLPLGGNGNKGNNKKRKSSTKCFQF